MPSPHNEVVSGTWEKNTLPVNLPAAKTERPPTQSNLEETPVITPKENNQSFFQSDVTLPVWRGIKRTPAHSFLYNESEWRGLANVQNYKSTTKAFK